MTTEYIEKCRACALVFFSIIVLSENGLLIAAPPADGGTKASKPSPTLILKSAASNENTFSNGEFISVLRGNVVFVYDDIRVRSDEATWWRTKGAVLFQRNIKVNRGRQVITCDRMNFTKENNLLTAAGRFNFFDSTDLSRLTGDQAEYGIVAKTFRLTGNPTMVRYDTARAETLTIKSVTMSYADSIKRATAIDNVSIRKGGLFSTCKLAHYYTVTNQAQLRGSPHVVYDLHQLTGDSISMKFDKESLREAFIVGNSHGLYVDTADKKSGDTAFTHIWGDSLYMNVSDSGKLDNLWSIGRAVSKNYENTDPEATNSASGKKMMLAFGADGNVRKLKIWGNARSTYFIEDPSGRGCNEVSGDSIAVSFSKGKARFVSLAGSTRGIYFPLP